MRERIIVFCLTLPNNETYEETKTFSLETKDQDIDDAYYDWLLKQTNGYWEEMI